MEIEERLNKIEYHQQLLLEMIKGNKYPLYELIIKKDLTRDEVDGIFQLCDELTLLYEQQKEEGFVHFTPLLTKFAGLLTYKVTPEEMIDTLINQKMYVQLMEVLKKTLKDFSE